MKVIAVGNHNENQLFEFSPLPLMVLGYQILAKRIIKRAWLYQNSLNHSKSKTMNNYLKEQCIYLLQSLGVDQSYSGFKQFERRTRIHLKTEFLLTRIENVIDTVKNYSIEGEIVIEAVNELREDISHFLEIQFLVNHPLQEQKIDHDKGNIRRAFEKLQNIVRTNTDDDRPTPKLLRLLKDIKTNVLSINHLISKAQENELHHLVSPADKE